ncbi:MAG: polysaccharide deacetylase family protein [Pricia sp.]
MKKLIFKILRYSGIPFLVREIVQRRKVTILLFHDIDEATAEKQFSYLLQNYNIISLNDFIYARENRQSLPPKALVITFDDGHIGNYQLLPIIERLKVSVTIFLCAEIIGSNRHFWFNYGHPKLNVEKMKKKSNKNRLDILSEAGFNREREYDDGQALTMKQIKEMTGTINLQAHALFHPIFPNCTDEEAKIEITGAKKLLENKFNLKINAIAYPNGDYSERDIGYAKSAGYQCGLTVDFGYNTLKTDPFKLKRLDADDTDDLNELIVKTTGLWGFFKTSSGRYRSNGLTKTLKQ